MVDVRKCRDYLNPTDVTDNEKEQDNLSDRQLQKPHSVRGFCVRMNTIIGE